MTHTGYTSSGNSQLFIGSILEKNTFGGNLEKGPKCMNNRTQMTWIVEAMKEAQGEKYILKGMKDLITAHQNEPLARFP